MCSVEGCDRKIQARGWCAKHYQRWYLTGDAEGTSRRTPAGRLLRSASIPDGCWEWQKTVNNSGYGTMWAGIRNEKGSQLQQLAHRLSYETFVGPIADGLTIDHLCRNRRCIRPDHLEVVDLATNIRRARNSPDCKRGHPLTEENIYRYKGMRLCRTCRAEATARRRAKIIDMTPTEAHFGA